MSVNSLQLAVFLVCFSVIQAAYPVTLNVNGLVIKYQKVTTVCTFWVSGTYEGALFFGFGYDTAVDRDVYGVTYDADADAAKVYDMTLKANTKFPVLDSTVSGTDNTITHIKTDYNELAYDVQFSRDCHTGDPIDQDQGNTNGKKGISVGYMKDYTFTSDYSSFSTRVEYDITSAYAPIPPETDTTQYGREYPSIWNQIVFQNGGDLFTLRYGFSFETRQDGKASNMIFWSGQISNVGYVGIGIGPLKKLDIIMITTSGTQTQLGDYYSRQTDSSIVPTVDASVEAYTILIDQYNSAAHKYSFQAYRDAQTRDFNGDTFIDLDKHYDVTLIKGTTQAANSAITYQETIQSVVFTKYNAVNQGFSKPTDTLWKTINFNNTFVVKYAYSQDAIWFRITGTNAGWIALGFGKNMSSTDVILIYDNSGTPVLSDRWASSNAQPVLDNTLPKGENNPLTVYSGGLTGSNWDITFYRVAYTGDKYDKNLKSSGDTTSLSLALGSSQDITVKHASVEILNNIWFSASANTVQGYSATVKKTSALIIQSVCTLVIILLSIVCV